MKKKMLNEILTLLLRCSDGELRVIRRVILYVLAMGKGKGTGGKRQ